MLRSLPAIIIALCALPLPAVDRRPREATRFIGVGFSGRTNLIYATDRCTPHLMWAGEFSEGFHPQDREASSAGMVELSDSVTFPAGVSFAGYELDPDGTSVFRLQLGSQSLRDSWKPFRDIQSSGLTRSITLDDGDGSVELAISNQLAASPLANGIYQLSDHLAVHIEGVEVETRCGRYVVVMRPGTTIGLTYLWL